MQPPIVFSLETGTAKVLPLVRAVPEIILRGGALFCPVGGGCFVDSVSEGWGCGE